jgi:hypothetical protein
MVEYALIQFKDGMRPLVKGKGERWAFSRHMTSVAFTVRISPRIFSTR